MAKAATDKIKVSEAEMNADKVTVNVAGDGGGAGGTSTSPSNDLALQTTGGVPAELAAMLEQDKGKGLSTRAEDNLVPLIYVLQPLSPQVASRNPAYIEGAEPGDIWLRQAAEPIAPGATGILVQPVFFWGDYAEWRPRDSGGGFIGRHATMPDDAQRTQDERNPNRVRFIRPNGNEVIETRNFALRVFMKNGQAIPYIIPFASTGHTTARQWMFMANQHNGAPLFARKYRLTTKERSNQAGTWFALEVADQGWVTADEYKAGLTLHNAFTTGEKRAEEPVEDVRSEAGADTTAGKRGNMDDEIPF